MSASFSAYPLNYTRFLELTRSTSRSLSPESELRQMTTRRAYVLNDPDKTRDDAECQREGDEAGVGATVSDSTTYHGTIHAHTSYAGGVGDRQPLPLASHITAQTGRPVSLRASGELCDDAPPLATTTVPRVTRQEESVATTSRPDRRAAYPAAVLPCAWHYGSPLYYPVTGLFYCWNGHPLYRKPRKAYVGVEGVSCDFCGYTHWQLGETTMDEAHVADSDAAEADPVVFFRCEQCGVDLCPQCLMDVRVDERYHVPCMQCLHCKVFIPLHDTAMHRCSRRVTLLTSSTPPSTQESLKHGKEDKSHDEGTARRQDGLSSDMSSAMGTITKRGVASGRGRGRQRGGNGTAQSSAFSDVARRGTLVRGGVTKRARTAPHESVGDWEVALTPATGLAHGTATVEQLAAELAVRVTFALTAEGEGEVGIIRVPTRLAAEKLAARAQNAGLVATVRLLRSR